MDCGPPKVQGHVIIQPNDFCALVVNTCAVGAMSRLPADPYLTTVAIVRRWQDGHQDYLGANCAARSGTPRVTPVLARQATEKLVPRPGIGVAPPGGRTLVNVQTVLWAGTPADRDLGTVILLGTYRVSLRVHVQRVVWAFGDGATDTTDTPGQPYRKGEHCGTINCPGHYGHVYTTTGRMTITSRVSWVGQYSVNGGAWQVIAGVVDGPPAATQVSVLEARGVLVSDPTPN
jgi:hypothetical protein